MLTPEQFNAKTIDFGDAQLHPHTVVREGGTERIVSDYKRSDYAVSEVLCSQLPARGVFAVGKTAGGKFVGLWDGHADLFETEAGLLAALNLPEKALLENKANLG